MKTLGLFLALGMFLVSGCASKSAKSCADGGESCGCTAAEMTKGAKCEACAAGKHCADCQKGKCQCKDGQACGCEKGKCT